MIEAPAVAPVEFALQAVDFRPQGGIFGLFGQTLSSLVIFPEQVGFRAKTTGDQVEDGAFDSDGNFLIELGHPEIGQTLALSFVRLNLSGKNAQKGGLAFPVSTEQADALFFVDGDADVVEQKRSTEGYGQVAVTDQGHVAKNSIKEGSDNPTRSGRKTEIVLDLRQSTGVQNVGGGQPTLAGGMNPGKLVVELMKGMGIRVDATKQALLGRPSPVSPVHVEAHGVGVKLEDLAVGDSRVDDLGDVHPAGFAPEQEPGAQVSEHRYLGMLEGGDDPGGHGLLVLGQSVMNGSHDVIEGVEYGILEVEFSAGENAPPPNRRRHDSGICRSH